MNIKYYIIYHTFLMYVSICINILGWASIFYFDPIKVIVHKDEKCICEIYS